MIRAAFRTFALLCPLLAGSVVALAQSSPQLETARAAIPAAQAVTARNGMVVAQESRAARIGADVLARGGNAVDAAVAVGFAMAVTYPRAGNLGGGGFMVIHRARGEAVAIDYRETAPAATTRDMFLDATGEPDARKSRDSALAIGIPGTVAGLALAHARYGSGRFALADLIAPAIPLASDGILVEDDVADTLASARDRFARWPASARIFLREGQALRPGERLVQADLAETLRAIANYGPRAFYEGAVADRIVAAVRAAGGIFTKDDLKNYRPQIRAPVRGSYRGYEILSMPPPSSGGIVLVEILNILEGYRLDAPSAANLHILIEAMKRAYADRARHLGDPDAVEIPRNLTSKVYAARLREGIGERATASSQLQAPREGANTTHFSVIDRDGNAVASTYTLNFSYGLGLVAEGTGVLLNNELDDFTAKPGTANAFGLVGYDANLPAPGKRPLSSMSPTIVLKDGKPVLVTGSPGGSRIISAVLQVIVNSVDFNMPIDRAVSAPRLHHQWMPDVVDVEPGFAPETLTALQARGHAINPRRPSTSANSLAVTPQGYVGAADPRTRGALAVGY